MDELALERVAPSAAADPEIVTGVLSLVNAAYDDAERTLWHIPLGRTNADEVGRWIAAGSVVTARASGRLVGSVTTHLSDAATGWFGALAVDPAWAGRGIASALVQFAERDAEKAGASEMQLELLEPDPPQDHQVRLRSWYMSIGYRPSGQLDLADVDPDSVQHARFPTHVVVMRKSLAGAPPSGA